jgi:hypothetical protein
MIVHGRDLGRSASAEGRLQPVRANKADLETVSIGWEADLAQPLRGFENLTELSVVRAGHNHAASKRRLNQLRLYPVD